MHDIQLRGSILVFDDIFSISHLSHVHLRCSFQVLLIEITDYILCGRLCIRYCITAYAQIWQEHLTRSLLFYYVSNSLRKSQKGKIYIFYIDRTKKKYVDKSGYCISSFLKCINLMLLLFNQFLFPIFNFSLNGERT